MLPAHVTAVEGLISKLHTTQDHLNEVWGLPSGPGQKTLLSS